MFRKFIIFLGFVFHNTIHSQDLGNNFRGYGNPFWPIAAPSSFSMQPIYGDDRVKVHVYYEALCPDCQNFISRDLMQTIMELGPRLDIHLLPYGNAQTVPNWYGGYDFISQHGPEETYGNKLHACAIDVLQNTTSATIFNSCLLDSSRGKSSDDAAAIKCGALLNVNANAIMQCAKSNRGSLLLKCYGDETKKVGIKWVPTIYVNGVASSHQGFRQDVYKAVTLNGRQSSFRGIS